MSYQLLGMDPLFNEVGFVVENAVNEGRDELEDTENEYIQGIIKRMVKEYKKQLSEIQWSCNSF